MSRDLLLFLRDIENACRKIIRFTDGRTRDEVLADEMRLDALLHNLQVIGERVSGAREPRDCGGGTRKALQASQHHRRARAREAGRVCRGRIGPDKYAEDGHVFVGRPRPPRGPGAGAPGGGIIAGFDAGVQAPGVWLCVPTAGGSCATCA